MLVRGGSWRSSPMCGELPHLALGLWPADVCSQRIDCACMQKSGEIKNAGKEKSADSVPRKL